MPSGAIWLRSRNTIFCQLSQGNGYKDDVFCRGFCSRMDLRRRALPLGASLTPFRTGKLFGKGYTARLSAVFLDLSPPADFCARAAGCAMHDIVTVT